METRICECCGRELPVSEFINRTFGASKICKKCNAAKSRESRLKKKEERSLEAELVNARNLRLQDFTPRELMAELARRGYRGKLEYVETRTIDLSAF